MNGPAPTSVDFAEALRRYATISEAYWRAFELRCLRDICRSETFERPILEIGCGDGAFSAMLFGTIDEGVDLNPRAVERARASGAYRRVTCADASVFAGEAGRYGTVFANCVLEHIASLQSVLATSVRALRPGGKLLATVPLIAMNDHLLVRRPWYAELRRRQLTHVNLLDEDAWSRVLREHGFQEVRLTPYLRGEDIAFWDRLDFPACLGVGRYRVSTALAALVRLAPQRLRSAARGRVAEWLEARAMRPRSLPASAAALVAVR